MLKDAGCSPRDRRPFPSAVTPCGETDADVRAKTLAAWRGPASFAIVCVGETRAEREAGRASAGLSAGQARRLRWPDGRRCRQSDRRVRTGLGGSAPGLTPDAGRHRRDPRGDPGPHSRGQPGSSTAARSNPKETPARFSRNGEVDGALVGGAQPQGRGFSGRSPRLVADRPCGGVERGRLARHLASDSERCSFRLGGRGIICPILMSRIWSSCIMFRTDSCSTNEYSILGCRSARRAGTARGPSVGNSLTLPTVAPG